jgi:hypothetical protein
VANFVFTCSKGRGVEFYYRVKNNDPSTSVLVLVPLSQSGTEAQGKALDTLADIEADANFAERTTGGWVKKVLADADLVAFPAPNDGTGVYEISVPSKTWTTPTTANNTTGLLVCYDALGTGVAANLIPISHHDFVVTTDGNDVVLNAGIFFQAA